MDLKTINRIVWWIPFKQLRNDIKSCMISLFGYSDYIIEPDDLKMVIEFRNSIEKDKNFIDKYIELTKGLDEQSVETVYDLVILKILNYKNIDDPISFSDEEQAILNKASAHRAKYKKKINENCYLYSKYLLPTDFFELGTFYGKYGMNYIQNMNKVMDKNIMDIGGAIGDSAIVLSDYTDKYVYSFEPMKDSYELMLKTIEMNHSKNIIPVKIALGNSNSEVNMCNNVISPENNRSNVEIVQMCTLDKYVEENNIEVGLIKTDLEGFEPKFLEGAINTIKKQKPVLIISIYHNYHDFFEIKPMIDSWKLGYKFKIIKLVQETIIVGTILLAEVY